MPEIEILTDQDALDLLKTLIPAGQEFGCSCIQRHLRWGYNRSFRIMEIAVNTGQAEWGTENKIWFHRPAASKSNNEKEPQPIKNDHPAVWNLVLADIAERDLIGLAKYGTRLQPFNGRDVLKDSFQEALDLVVYLRQAIYERDGK